MPARRAPQPAAPGSVSAEHLAAALALFSGPRQREWVAAMASPHGLHLAAGQSGRFAPMIYGRILGVVQVLERAGFHVSQLPLGPRGGRRHALLDYRPELAAVLAATAGRAEQRRSMWSTEAVRSWASSASPASRDVFAALAPDFSGSFDELALVAAAAVVER